MNNNNIIIEMYKEGKSTYEICERLNQSGETKYYPNKINRLLKKIGHPLRSKSESQKIALATKRSIHPTLGKERTFEEKIKIGKSIHENWKCVSEEKKKSRSEKAKKNWDKLSQEAKDDLHAKAAKAVRRAADIGSKLERYIVGKLRQDYKVDFHTRHQLSTGLLELDIYLPELKVVIEVNGISHYRAIYDEETLDRVQVADKSKNGMVAQAGLIMIRIKSTGSKIGITKCMEVYRKLNNVLEQIKDNPNLPVEKRFIYIEGD